MAKEQFDLSKFELLPDGTYRKKKTVFQPREISKPFVPNELYPFQNNIRINPSAIKSTLTIDGIIAGLNGDEGLMRAHWTKIKKIKSLYAEIIRLHLLNGRIRNHEGKVKITYIGYKSRLMDWDNFCSSFKHIGDSLVKAQIITDDKPSVIISFIPQQIKCKRVEQKAVVIIEDI